MIAAIIQARMGSTRLPRKVLMTIDGQPLLQLQLERVAQSKLIDKIVVATTTSKADDVLYDYCVDHKIECFRGSENDVLQRYYDCAKQFGASVIVRLTADCPFSDPAVIDKTIELYNRSNVDYAANTVPPDTSTFPDGSDVEVFSFSALERAHREARDQADREHVTFYFWKSNKTFRTAQLKNDENWSPYRFTVDYPEDLEVITFVVRELRKHNTFGHIPEIIHILNSHPDIKSKNENYYFGIGWKK